MGRGRSKLGGGFSPLTDKQEADFFAKQKITAKLQKAFDNYTNPNTERGSLYNFSQNMNKAIAEDRPLSKIQQDTFDQITGAMRPIGEKMQLTRYDHADTVNEILSKAGVSGDASRMSAAELSNALVGVSYTDKRILSTSVNGFRNSADPTTFTTRQFKITYNAKPGVKGVMPGAGKIPLKGSGMTKGDDFGELLLSPNSKYKITAVRPSGEKSRRKGRPKWDLSTDQIEIVVEVG